MKRICQLFVFVVFAITTLASQNPKREVRATWLSTVWRLDWPSTTVPAATGTNEASREAARNVQKSGLLSVLEKLKAANFNTVFFQVRGMCDAFYDSNYEPWSQYLSSARGADPGWDPLAFLIEEGHARGIEVHAWLNPYRYSTSADSHGNLPDDYATVHPEWLLDYGGSAKILNPGLPEVRQRICDVVADLLTNYDVDGIVFDDYFYNSGTTDAMDQQQFQLYNPGGLSRGDWRRENVNQMIKDVQARINSIKPYVTFGVSPAGVAASDENVARKYGVEKCPVGSDWQYNGIYSDPLAWLYNGTIDYISPQNYWATGTTNDYSKLSPWWSKVANFFGRQYYSSNTSTFSATELINEININRNADLNGTSGMVYFRTNNLSTTNLNAFKAAPYQQQALGGVYGWKNAPSQGLVEGVFVSGQNLSWNYSQPGARYSIYAIPRSDLSKPGLFTTPEYLLGISYSKSYTLPSGITAASHAIAVAVYDRYGHEYSPRFYGEVAGTTGIAQLTYPAPASQQVVLPALFTWLPVGGAAYYKWELAEDESFTRPITTREIVVPEFYSGLQTNIKENKTYYWRVKTITPNAPVTVSEVRSFEGTKFKITSPADGSDAVPMTAEFNWTGIGDGASYTLELSGKSDFNPLIYTKTVDTTSALVPEGILATSTIYYARVKAVKGSAQAISERIQFTTVELPVPVPTLLSPANGTTVYGNTIELSWQVQVSKGFRAELSQNATFPTRSTSLSIVDASTFKTTYTNLKDGTYYLRVRALNKTGLTEPSDYITVHLITVSSIHSVNETDFCYHYYDSNDNCHIVIENALSTEAKVEIYSSTGMITGSTTYSLTTGRNTLSPDLTKIGSGFYLIVVQSGEQRQVLKVRK